MASAAAPNEPESRPEVSKKKQKTKKNQWQKVEEGLARARGSKEKYPTKKI